jgi:hypothetical protein
MTALGYDVPIDTPLGPRTISFDLDKVSADVSAQLVTDAWPLIEAQARQALPTFVGDAVTYARPELDAQKDSLIKQGGVLVGLLALSVIGAAWYVGRAPSTRRRRATA